MANKSTPKAAQSDDDILAEARKRFRKARDYSDEIRTDALDDLKFVWNFQNFQWPPEILKIRAGRPCMTDNRLPAFIRQVVNAQRQNRPAIAVAPASGDATVQIAKVKEGLVRHSEQCSKADLAYDTAFEAAVSSSFGYFRVSTRYVDDASFDQEIEIAPIDNPFSVYDDPDFEMPDGSDRRYCFVTEMVDREDFEAEYGFEPAEVDDGGMGDDFALWVEDKKVRVAEYWRLRTERQTLTQERPPEDVELPEDWKPKERQVERHVVEQFLMTGDKIIKRTSWNLSKLPVIPVYGEQKVIEGKRYLKSLIRDVKELARANNYWFSSETESVALQPKAPWVGPVGSFETDAAKWESANSENYATLEYDVVYAEDGVTPLPPPQRTAPPAFPAALRETRMGLIEAMKSTMGLFDASLGARTNEVSGVAIEARADQGSLATFHFVDNMSRALRYAGEVMIELQPQIYDNQRVVRILSPDGDPEMVAINALFPQIDPRTGMAQQSYNIAQGRYDVVVKAGPNVTSQREETAQRMEMLIKAFPPILQVGGDILVKNLDFPGADELAQRMAPQGGIPPQVQQQIQQMQQAIGQAKDMVANLSTQLQQEKLKVARAEVDKASLGMQLKDKSDAIANDRTDTISENTRFVIETLMRALELQVNARTPQNVMQEAGAMKPGIEQLIAQQ